MAYQTASKETRELLSVKDASELFSVHPKTVLRWRKSGRLNAVRVGPRCIRFRRSAVEALLHQGEEGTPLL